MPDFLLEIGIEEIPARMIDSARDELARRIGDLLQRERLSDTPTIHAYSTPRRLAVVASGVSAAQPDVREQITGPSLKVAYKDGAPTPAAQAFARKVNMTVDALEKITTPKGEYLCGHRTEDRAVGIGHPGRSLAERNCRYLLGQEHVLARQVGRALRAPCTLAGDLARRRGRALGIRRHSRRTRHRRPSHSRPRGRLRSTSHRNMRRPWRTVRLLPLPRTASSSSARPLMRRRVPSPVLAGAKIRPCSIPSSTSRNSRRWCSAAMILSFFPSPMKFWSRSCATTRSISPWKMQAASCCPTSSRC